MSAPRIASLISSRVIEIATFLDNDIKQRPPPPPVLKAYVRRAAAQAELGRYVAPPINCDGVPSSPIESH